MDKYDKEILSVLLENGKIQLSELSNSVIFSPAACDKVMNTSAWKPMPTSLGLTTA